MWRPGPIVAFALGLSIGSVAYVLGQPGNPVAPYGSTAGEFQRDLEYNPGGDHVAVNLAGQVTTPTPARPDRCYAYCDANDDTLKLSVDGSPFTALGGSGASCVSCGTPGVIVAKGNDPAATPYALVIGPDVTTATSRQTFVHPSDASGTNNTGSSLLVGGSCGTGSGTGGDLGLQSCPPTTPGATPGTRTTRWSLVSSTGHLNPAANGVYDIGNQFQNVRIVYTENVHVNGLLGVNQALCITGAGLLGQCSSVVASDGTCTCN